MSKQKKGGNQKRAGNEGGGPACPGPKCKHCGRHHHKVRKEDCFKKDSNTKPVWCAEKEVGFMQQRAERATKRVAKGAAKKE